MADGIAASTANPDYLDDRLRLGNFCFGQGILRLK
jgi:hypothetical protein